MFEFFERFLSNIANDSNTTVNQILPEILNN